MVCRHGAGDRAGGAGRAGGLPGPRPSAAHDTRGCGRWRPWPSRSRCSCCCSPAPTWCLAALSARSFSQPLNHTDALYFTVTVFATVGAVDSEGGHRPARAAAGDAEEKVGEHLAAARRVRHLGVELHAVEAALLVDHGGGGRVLRLGDEAEPLGERSMRSPCDIHTAELLAGSEAVEQPGGPRTLTCARPYSRRARATLRRRAGAPRAARRSRCRARGCRGRRAPGPPWCGACRSSSPARPRARWRAARARGWIERQVDTGGSRSTPSSRAPGAR